jgi:hypothetical protein
VTMNPTLDPRIVERALEQDPDRARAEYLGEFRTDVEGFVAREALDAVVVPHRRELPPAAGVRYVAFVDPSGGSADSFTLAIAHRTASTVVLDAVRERRPPFSPDAVVEEYADLLRSYRVAMVVGDRYAGEWPRERFRVHGIVYEPAARPKSELYLAMLPLINSGVCHVELLDDPKLLTQLSRLERRTSRGGRDSVDHPPKEHDDLANACAGVLSLLVKPRPKLEIWSSGDDNVALNQDPALLQPGRVRWG